MFPSPPAFLSNLPLALYDPRGYSDGGWWHRLPLSGWGALILLILIGIGLYVAVRKREGSSSRNSMLDLLNKQYTQGLITKEEFEHQKRKIKKKK